MNIINNLSKVNPET